MTAPQYAPEPEPAPNVRRTWAYLGLSALALFYVLFAPFSVFISPEAVVPWYAGVAALTWVGVLLVARRPVFNCLEVFVPMVATVWVVAFTAAQPDVIGLWIPVAQGLGMLAIIVLLRVRGPGRQRQKARTSPSDTRSRYDHRST